MFTNKHIIIALLVAPVLAILAWFAVGNLVGEKPQQAIPGQSYPLVERSNCRYDSAQCDLRNEDMELSITLEDGAHQPALVLVSSRALDGVLVAISGADEGSPPTAMRESSDDGRRWWLQLNSVPADGQRLRIAVQASGSSWFADASTAFLERHRN